MSDERMDWAQVSFVVAQQRLVQLLAGPKACVNDLDWSLAHACESMSDIGNTYWFTHV
jgi:hypothetical protein